MEATAMGEANESDWGAMTPEQREADVDQALGELQEARDEAAGVASAKPEEKPEETKQTTETTGKGEETPAVTDAAADDGDDSEEEEGSEAGQGEGEDGEGSESDWLDAETRDFATTMGLTEEDLATLSSREDLDRVVRIIDRKAFETGRQLLAGDGQGGGAERKEPPEKKEPPAARKETPGETGDLLADLAKFKLAEDFDEAAAKPINAFVEAASTEIRNLRNEIAGFKQEREQEAAADVQRRALDSLHSLGHKELFGESGKPPTKEQAANIAKAIEEHYVHANGLFAMGRQAAPTPAFLRAAVRRAFGDQIFKQEQQQRIEKLKKQSQKRTGGGASKPLPRRKSKDTLEELVTDPDIDKRFNELVSERSG
jgi:hypothetical protein